MAFETIVELHVGDTGTKLRRTVKDGGLPVDLTGATVTDFLATTPKGVAKKWTASILTPPGLDGILQYVTLAGDLSEDGEWQLQVHLTLPTGDWHSAREVFKVEANLKEP